MENKYTKKEKLEILLLIFTISGIFGFIYETIFYRIDLGYFVKRGTSFGPWIPIYGYGSIFILLLTYKFKNKPYIVFLLSALISGILEFIVGYLLFNILNLRLWNYNTEIWNFGNIGGYVCARSVLFFAVSGLLLLYVILPFTLKLKSKLKPLTFSKISIIISIIFIIDVVINSLLTLL